MDKDRFSVRVISKGQCATVLNDHHYLSSISKGFKSGLNFGLFLDDMLVGCCIFTGLPVPELAKGMFGLDRADQGGILELSRLCLLPTVQGIDFNVASFFVSKCLRALKKNKARAVLSYADDDFHIGTVYQACNFKYYGLTARRKDFWIKQAEGSYVKHSRGKVRGLDGEWRERSRKHRYLIVFDTKLKPLWSQQEYPKRNTQ